MDKLLIKVGLKQQDPKELMREWQRKMQREKRAIDKQIREIEREERKVELDIKRLARQGNQEASMRILAKEIVNSRKAVARLYVANANINSVSMQMKSMAAQANVAKVMGGSAETMKAMQQLVSMPETMHNMKELAREMEKAGFLQEMMDDMMDTTTEQEELDVDDAVSKVILEVTMDKLNAAPTLNARRAKASAQEEEEEEEEEEEDAETNALEQRLRNLS